MKRWIARFMYGRYGYDSFGAFLLMCGYVCIGVGLLFQIITVASKVFLFKWITMLFFSLSLLVFCYTFFRILSRDRKKRLDENGKYLGASHGARSFLARLKLRFLQRKTHRFFSCPKCNKTLRVPKGKGKIRIKCKECGHEFVRKT